MASSAFDKQAAGSVAPPSPTPDSSARSTAEDIEASQKETKALVLAALGAVAFIAISIFSIRDCNLLSGNGTVKLPLLDVDVPVHAFFFAAPIFLLLLFAYVQVDLRRAAEGVSVDERFKVWPLSEFPPRRLGNGLLISTISIAVVWGSWPALMALLTWKVLPIGHAWLSPLAVTTTAVAFAVSIPNYTAVHCRRPLTARSRTRMLAVVILGAGSFIAWTICARVLHPRNLPVHFTDFKGADIGGLDLSGRNLRNANFTKANLTNGSLTGSNLARAIFTSAELEFADLCRSALDGASFRGAHARGAKFRCGQLNLRTLIDVDFTDANLRQVNFATASVRRLSGTNLSGASFWSSDLANADLSNTEITRADFSEARAPRVSFRDARGSRPVFYRARLESADFTRAQLERPNFTAANLQGADFAEGSMAGALLAGANLERANLRGCNFSTADLRETRFRGSTYDRFTVAPAGFDYAAHGMVRRD